LATIGPNPPLQLLGRQSVARDEGPIVASASSAIGQVW
jgi:hypothetical protein